MSQIYLHIYVYCSTIPNTQVLGPAKVLSSKWMDKENEFCLAIRMKLLPLQENGHS